jgi:CRISPR-associated protein Csx16
MRLISFLGTGDYKPTTYFLPSNQNSVQTPYVALALAKLFTPVECVILATEQAEAVHFAKLKKEFAQAGLPAPSLCRIHSGSTEKELWDNFERLYELFQGQEDILLDITHGFRAQPLFAAAVVTYAKTLDDQLSVRIVYGAFEARANGHTPIWDLTPFVELTEWTWALAAFFKTGYAKSLAQLAQNLGAKLAREWAETRVGSPPQLKKFARALEAFGDALATVRVGELLVARDEHSSSARWLAEALEKAKAEIEAHFPPLAKGLSRLEEMVAPLLLDQDHLAGPQGQQAMAALASLYLGLARYAETGIVLREGWVNLYATPEATRPGEQFDEAARREAERRLTQAGWNERELMGLRNDLEHGGFRKCPLSAKTIYERLLHYVEAFKRAQAAEVPQATTWFVSRHNGAVEWASRQGIRVERQVAHLDVEEVKAGDVVIGTLPINLAAEVCARGARFFNLSLDVPPEARGRELSAEEIERFGARVEEYRIEKIESEGVGVKS